MASLPVPGLGGARAGAATASRLWWRIHQWAGLKLSLILSFILLTGSLAVVSHEIDWALHASMRVAPASVAGAPDWERIGAAALAHPGADAILSLEAPTARFFAATAVARRADQTLFLLDIHPTTGAVQGERPWASAQRVLRNLHRHLNMPTRIGVPIVSSLALLLAVSLATSLLVYKRWWRGFLSWPRGRDARTWLGDAHRLLGVWSLWFALLIVLTSLWYLAESTVARAPDFPRPTAAPVGADVLAAQLGPALAAARAANPELRIDRVILPTASNGVFRFEGQWRAELVRGRANAIVVEAGTARVLHVGDGRAASLHQRISEAADPLHFGTFGGYWTKVPWFLFGLLLTGLSVSGAALYGMRIARTKNVRGQGRNLFGRTWTGMGLWRWPSAALVIVGLVLIATLS